MTDAVVVVMVGVISMSPTTVVDDGRVMIGDQ